MNKRINGRWLYETNASKKRKAKIARIYQRMEQLEQQGRLTSKTRKMYLDRIERLNY